MAETIHPLCREFRDERNRLLALRRDTQALLHAENNQVDEFTNGKGVPKKIPPRKAEVERLEAILEDVDQKLPVVQGQLDLCVVFRPFTPSDVIMTDDLISVVGTGGLAVEGGELRVTLPDGTQRNVVDALASFTSDSAQVADLSHEVSQLLKRLGDVEQVQQDFRDRLAAIESGLHQLETRMVATEGDTASLKARATAIEDRADRLSDVIARVEDNAEDNWKTLKLDFCHSPKKLLLSGELSVLVGELGPIGSPIPQLGTVVRTPRRENLIALIRRIQEQVGVASVLEGDEPIPPSGQGDNTPGGPIKIDDPKPPPAPTS